MRPEDEMAVYEPDDAHLDGFDKFLLWVAGITLVGVVVMLGFLLYRIFNA